MEWGFLNMTWHVVSIIAENKPHVHHKMKVYDTRPSQFC